MTNKAISVYADALKRKEQEGARQPSTPKTASPVQETKQESKPRQPAKVDATKPRHRATTVSRYHDTVIELVRKAVKGFGKEAATHRFTAEEKKAIADLIYAYKGQGTRTSENEITRIAVNFILNDYKQNGKSSVLDRTLRALNE
jgi:hypothetical protein